MDDDSCEISLHKPRKLNKNPKTDSLEITVSMDWDGNLGVFCSKLYYCYPTDLWCIHRNMEVRTTGTDGTEVYFSKISSYCYTTIYFIGNGIISHLLLNKKEKKQQVTFLEILNYFRKKNSDITKVKCDLTVKLSSSDVEHYILCNNYWKISRFH